MMKINRYIGFVVALLAVSFWACKEDDTTVSTITSFEKFSTEVPAAIEVPEADATYTIDLSYSDAQIMDIHVEVSAAESSTAAEHEDFDLHAHDFSVAALERTASIDIDVHADFEPEGNETVVLHLMGLDPHGLPTPVEQLVLTIRDSIYPVAVLLDWSGTFQYAGSTFTFCGNVDIDLFLADDQGNFVGGFGGATAACPELMFTGTLADGTYDIVANLYDNGLFGAPDIDTIPIPMRVSIFKGGVLSDTQTTLKYSTADYNQIPVWTAYTESDPNGEHNVVVGQIRVGGGTVTLVNPDGADVGSLNK
jgi:hypothetical protein